MTAMARLSDIEWRIVQEHPALGPFEVTRAVQAAIVDLGVSSGFEDPERMNVPVIAESDVAMVEERATAALTSQEAEDNRLLHRILQRTSTASPTDRNVPDVEALTRRFQAVRAERDKATAILSTVGGALAHVVHALESVE